MNVKIFSEVAGVLLDLLHMEKCISQFRAEGLDVVGFRKTKAGDYVKDVLGNPKFFTEDIPVTDNRRFFDFDIDASMQRLADFRGFSKIGISLHSFHMNLKNNLGHTTNLYKVFLDFYANYIVSDKNNSTENYTKHTQNLSNIEKLFVNECASNYVAKMDKQVLGDFFKVALVHTLIKNIVPENKLDKVINDLALCTNYDYYTPTPLAERLQKEIYLAFSARAKQANKSFSGLYVLDPTAGTGRFCSSFENMLNKHKADNTFSKISWLSNDINLISSLVHERYNDLMKLKNCEILQENTNGSKFEKYIRNFDFFEIGARTLSKFDVVISNIPFGQFPATGHKNYGMYIHNAIMKNTLDSVQDGALCAFIVTSHLNSLDESFKENLLRSSTLLSALRLPSNTFKYEGLSQLDSCVLIFQKGRVREQLSDLENRFVKYRYEENLNSVPLEDRNNNFFNEVNTLGEYQATKPMYKFGEYATNYSISGDELSFWRDDEKLRTQIYEPLLHSEVKFSWENPLNMQVVESKEHTNSKSKIMKM